MPDMRIPEETAAKATIEQRRLDAVRRYDVLDTRPDGAFDHITALASQLLRVPVAIVSVVDHDRIWFKSRHGLDVEQINRDHGTRLSHATVTGTAGRLRQCRACPSYARSFGRRIRPPVRAGRTEVDA